MSNVEGLQKLYKDKYVSNIQGQKQLGRLKVYLRRKSISQSKREKIFLPQYQQSTPIQKLQNLTYSYSHSMNSSMAHKISTQRKQYIKRKRLKLKSSEDSKKMNGWLSGMKQSFLRSRESSDVNKKKQSLQKSNTIAKENNQKAEKLSKIRRLIKTQEIQRTERFSTARQRKKSTGFKNNLQQIKTDRKIDDIDLKPWQVDFDDF